MENENKLKIILGIIYLSIVTGFLLLFFSYFSFDDFSSFELIKNNRDKLNDIKNSNLLIASILFFIGVIIWVMLRIWFTSFFSWRICVWEMDRDDSYSIWFIYWRNIFIYFCKLFF